VTVTELISQLNDKSPDSQVVVNVGGNQVESFTLETDTDGVVCISPAQTA